MTYFDYFSINKASLCPKCLSSLSMTQLEEKLETDF